MLKGWVEGRSLWPAAWARTSKVAVEDTTPEAADESWQDDVLPWLAGAVEWSERYGTLIAEARRWRLCAFFALGLAAVAVAGAVSLARATKVVPYIVQVDRHGFMVPIKPAERSTAADERNVRSAAANWVLQMRTVIGNADAQYDLIQSAYTKMAQGSRAWNKANAWMVEHNPMDQIGSRRVEVEITRVYSMGTIERVRVEWIEREQKQSAVVETHLGAYLTIEISPPEKQEDVISNPSGVFIADYTISQM